VIVLPTRPRLVEPTGAVRISYLTGEQADCVARGIDLEWLGPASRDFDGYIAERQGTIERWNVPSTIYWYVAGEHYLGTLVIRHRLTEALLVDGGHIGYNVVTAWQRQGHATAMLAAGVTEARQLGLKRILLTCAPENEPSQRVILANGGEQDQTLGAELRYWIDTDPD
jgi:predicted acetyltransferase